ncbi:MAG: exodeoxyribonuclease III [Mariprofundaceae bacterium]|nr:exodeoxyribonuclease III [Mariprofundaceae bacterium]
MKIISFNVNGIRARQHQLEQLCQSKPEIIGLQEIKAQDADFPIQAVESLGYTSFHFGQKGHYGVSFMVRNDIATQVEHVQRAFPHDPEDVQRRMIALTLKTDSGIMHILNGYFPQGESRDHPTKFPAKQKFYADLLAWLESDFKAEDQVILMGDINVAAHDHDIGIGPENMRRWLRTGKCSFLPEERQWLQKIEAWGLTDSFRHFHPDVDDQYSWFDYRSRGFNQEPKRGLRIDSIMVSASLLARCQSAGMDYDLRAMEKPSDHCPIFLELA